jgi:N-acetylglucosaminyldiphosphoundecaprenol N-acetyl-beta-D-mannosaminyltransferase
LKDAHSGLRIAGSRAWYGPSETTDAIVADEIRNSGAKIVLVGLGQPRQEAWIAANKDRVGAAILIAVGGYFEHAARSADCYPGWVYRWHLNWAYRLFKEPGRLWKRYLFGMTRFAFEVLKCRIVNGRDSRRPASERP